VGNEACVLLPSPTHFKFFITPNMHFVNTGVPHAVLFVPDVEKVDVAGQGKTLRHSPLFSPAGANVNFVSLCENTLDIRTYERGVEAETQACGTGSTAAALIAHKIFQLPSPIAVKVRSGEILKISFTPDFSNVTLQGAVQRF
jgi:diaminopimelate epimerase